MKILEMLGEDCDYEFAEYADELLGETILLNPSELEDTITELIEEQQLNEEDEEDEEERKLRLQFLKDFSVYLNDYPEPREDLPNLFEYFRSLLENYGRREFRPPAPYSTAFIAQLTRMGWKIRKHGGRFYLI